jgi:hypothetical protein
MSAPEPPATADAVIAGALAAEGVDASYAAFVARHLDASDASWRWCCGSACDPCVARLGRAVDRARAALRRPVGSAAAEGIPPAAGRA